MPTNVTVEYALAKQEYNKAQTTEEKIKALQKMLSTAPTHKGAENLRQDIKTKLAKFKRKQEKEKEQKAKGKAIAIKKRGFRNDCINRSTEYREIPAIKQTNWCKSNSCRL